MKLIRFLLLLGFCLGPLRAQAADPEEAQYNVVVNLYNAGQWQAAIKKIEEREKLVLPDPMRARYLCAKGLAYEKGEKTAEARAAYEQLLGKYPQSPECRTARIALIHMDYAAHNSDGVIQGYGALDKNGVGDAEKRSLALMFAEALYAKDDPRRAREAYEAAIQLGVDKTAVVGRLFDLYSRLQMYQQLVDISSNGIPGVDADLVSLARAESLAALGRTEEAGAQAAKIPASSSSYPRACYTRGLALIKLGKLKEAVEPLTVAVQNLKDPPVPPQAYLALADCLLASGKPKEAEPHLARAERLAASLPAAEKDALLKQVAFVKLRQSIDAGNRKEMIQTITRSRDSIPKDQLPRLLYMQLFALSEEGDDAAVVQTMKDDCPVFQAAPEDGTATLIYYTSLRKLKRQDEALKLLEDFVRRKPAAPEAVRARLELANAAFEKQEFDKAVPYLDAIRSAPSAESQLGRETFHKILFNRAVAAEKLNKPDDAIQTLNQLILASPTNSILRQAYVLLGQSYAVKSDYKTASDTWKKALASASPSEEIDLRDRLGRVLYAAKDYAGSCEQFDALTRRLGSSEKLSRESAEIWARALFSSGKFGTSAALYEELVRRFRDSPAYAYECAVAMERDGKMTDAAKWYAVAEKAKDKLPAEYAKAVDGNLAHARLQSGTEDSGAAYWSESLSAQSSDATFESALVSMRKLATEGKLSAAAKSKLEAAMSAYGADHPRYYSLGALLLQALSAEGKTAEMRQRAGKLAAEFAAHESKLDPKSPGATLAPAIIYFCKGEADRLAGSASDALVSYETILSAYPYNEWPDAAACGAAECYAALGDKKTALAKFTEVTKTAAHSPASAKWSELAAKRVNELSKGE